MCNVQCTIAVSCFVRHYACSARTDFQYSQQHKSNRIRTTTETKHDIFEKRLTRIIKSCIIKVQGDQPITAVPYLLIIEVTAVLGDRRLLLFYITISFYCENNKSSDGNYDTNGLHKLTICNHHMPTPFHQGGFKKGFRPLFDNRGLPQSVD